MEGSTISHFRILRQIACGGMGVVYEAEDLNLSRSVALKFLPEDLSADPRAMERFHREARAASSLNHPNICTIYEIGKEGGKTFIAMELISGCTLADAITAQPMDLRRILDLSVQIADALAVVHAKGLIHRDLKPANIFVTKTGLAKVLDFGLAKDMARPAAAASMTASESLTGDHAAVGTLMYMSPEQSLGKELDCRTDIFSLGVVLYQMCTGVLPFRGDTSPAVFDAILHAQPTSAVRLNPDLPESLERAISRCLEKEPQLRFQTSGDLHAELQRIRRDLFSSTSGPIAAQPSTRVITIPRFRPRYAIAAAIVLLLAAAGWWGIRKATGGSASADRTIAVLPFTSSEADPNVDFLRVAVPDDIVTSLSRVRTLSVRPFSQTMGASTSNDVPAIAKRLGVQAVLTGYFLHRGQQVHLAMEVIGADGQLAWRDSVDANLDDVMSLQEKAKQRIFDFLAEHYGLTAETGPGAAPSNKNAFDLYMKAAAVPWQPGRNGEAVSLLQQAVSLDPKYAPAWYALGTRYSFEAGVGLAACPCEPGYGTDDTAREQAKLAFERAASLDPLYVDPVAALVVFEAGDGKTSQAYDRAAWIVSRRADSVQAHLSLAYVYRFAGLLEKSAQECDQAYALDPGSSLLRSCAFGFMELGRYDRALKYVATDGDSEWAARTRADISLRQGQDAARVINSLPASAATSALLQACFGKKGEDEVRKLGLAAESDMPPGSDAEAAYFVAAYESVCKQNAPAVRLLKRAIAGGYCSVPALDSDPLFAPMHSDPLYESIHRDAVQCQKDFVAHLSAR